MNVASERLPTPAVKIGKAKDDKGVSDDRYGVAILIVHEGREGVFALVSWWVGENMLQHHVYFSSSDFPCSFEYISPSGIAACVWEMEVLAFERDAWVEHVLANPSGPNLEMYLTRQLNADV